MPWSNCDSHSNIDCLTRRCPFAEILYYIDAGSPEVKCNKPNNHWIGKSDKPKWKVS